MRLILLSLFIFPVIAHTQVNRSARELASETIGEYITGKLFKNYSYKPVSFGELKTRKEKEDLEIAWTFEHQFVVTDTIFETDKKLITHSTSYKFLFYLDNQMRVKRAETFYTN
jgi:hypothetical protein